MWPVHFKRLASYSDSRPLDCVIAAFPRWDWCCAVPRNSRDYIRLYLCQLHNSQNADDSKTNQGQE